MMRQPLSGKMGPGSILSGWRRGVRDVARAALEERRHRAIVRAVDVQQHMEPCVVAGLHQVRELVRDDELQACAGVGGEICVDADGACRGRAGAPAGLHAAQAPSACAHAHGRLGACAHFGQRACKLATVQLIDEKVVFLRGNGGEPVTLDGGRRTECRGLGRRTKADAGALEGVG